MKKLKEEFPIIHNDYMAATAPKEESIFATSSSSDSGVTTDEVSQATKERTPAPQTPLIYLEDVRTVIVGRASQELSEFTQWQRLRSNWEAALHNAMGLSGGPSSPDNDWHSYLSEVMQLAKLPRIARTSHNDEDSGAYRMSEEFSYL